MATNCVPAAAAADVCANCGREGGDGTKLKSCMACLLVKYCCVDCQKAHRKQHKRACKKRVAELKDEQLYSRGHERPEGDFCPICTLAIPLPVVRHSGIMVCCMKSICDGCSAAAGRRGMSRHCPYCRTPMTCNKADQLAMVQARAAKRDPAAIHFLGLTYFHGEMGIQKDIRKAVEITEEAAELGSVEALSHIGYWYTEGVGVEVDEAKGMEFSRKAAMQGNAGSRHFLGMYEFEKCNYDLALRHWMISAKLGHELSVEAIKNLFVKGLATKKQYTEALRGYQDAEEDMKSHDRDLAKKIKSERL
ncbi:hypothetical protein THAOC_00315 [Thalassiosira oceanica]|uniref:MYND-type domain-containing protein n=1 Tax=Thalassiosira oceanica TaxID=159749 RepID=K0TPD0_THAOC|nr:hypothetical protein THAOC_00315 [Thalassiosira oceanica]|eukprot:EJK77826.1 hypothetical protein THAOC_00315 [Thalassiosira oceanica]